MAQDGRRETCIRWIGYSSSIWCDTAKKWAHRHGEACEEHLDTDWELLEDWNTMLPIDQEPIGDTAEEGV